MCKKIVIIQSLQSDIIIPAGANGEPYLSSRRLSENRKPAAEKPFRPDFPLIFVTRTNCLYKRIKKSDSKWLPLATVPILGQPQRCGDANQAHWLLLAMATSQPLHKEGMLQFSDSLLEMLF